MQNNLISLQFSSLCMNNQALEISLRINLKLLR